MGKLLASLFVAGKMGKLLVTGGSMILSVFTYSLIFGWTYAVGFVLLIFFHEMGHYIAARLCGLNVGMPMFIPFVGAWINLKEMPLNVHTEAYVGFAGPLVGTIAALVCYWIARSADNQLMLALAYAGFMINLFNLIPISPLDGGRITAIISPRVWLLGVPLLVGLFIYNPSPMLVLIGLLALPQIKAALRKDVGASNLPERYYDVPTEVRVNYAIFYLGLTGFLAIMTYQLHNALSKI